MRYALGLLGFFFGIVGLSAAIAGPHIAQALKPPEPPPPKLSDTIAEAGDKLVGRVLDRVRGRKTETATTATPSSALHHGTGICPSPRPRSGSSGPWPELERG